MKNWMTEWYYDGIYMTEKHERNAAVMETCFEILSKSIDDYFSTHDLEADGR